MLAPFGAVLFDWRGTLFHDEDDAAWIRASAASIGQTLTTQEVSARVEMLEYVRADRPSATPPRV
jgi:hypothetical protein